MIPFPDKKYSVIYADPPWNYNDKCQAGERGAAFKYPTMNIGYEELGVVLTKNQ